MDDHALSPIVIELILPVDRPTAFELWTAGFTSWWPAEYTWSQDVLEWIGIDPQLGGRCTERGPNGFECDWGHVTGWDPPEHVELAWQISPRREPVPDPARASRIAVRFTEQSTGTVLRFEHDRFERHGDEGATYRNALNAPEGWPYILTRYCEAAASLVRA